MASRNPSGPTEKTFTSFSTAQSKAYAAARFDYSDAVYDSILNHHKSTGGQLGTMLDIGCGPGMVARWFAPFFDHTIGLDPSESMISTARELSNTQTQPIRFDVSSAEELGQNLEPTVADSSVDLLTAANAAHWFDMPQFWRAAARVVKSGGTVALWTTGETAIDPSLPNAEAIQKALDDYVENHLMAYFEPGNYHTRDRYANLATPWATAETADAFDESTFYRRNWEVNEPFVVTPQNVPLDLLEKVFASTSPQIRWYAAHPEAKGTDQDVLKQLRRRIQVLLHEAGVEEGKEVLQGGLRAAVLMFKRK